MRLDLRKKILTLVVTIFASVIATAAPLDNKPQPATKDIKKAVDEPTRHRQFEMDSIEMREQKPPRGDVSTPDFTASRIVRKHSRSLYTGLWTGTLTTRDTETVMGVRLDFQNDNSNETGQSFGLTILANNFYGAHWDFHKNCCLGGYSEFFWGYGIGSLWSPAEALPTFVNIDRYHVRGRAGFEDLFRLKRRLRAEGLVEWGTLGFNFSVLVGWTWDEKEFIF